MVDQHGAQALAEAETVAARAWEREPTATLDQALDAFVLCWAFGMVGWWLLWEAVMHGCSGGRR